ncbi:MAG: insulinase family protein [Sedimentisphaerales bacterium]|nr:insulinase family protein [Sedimentisphaerales bacterium]
MRHARQISMALLCGVMLATWTGVPAGAGARAASYKQLQYPPLHEVVVPDVQRVTLPNGMRLFVLEDHELPLINMSARIRVGSIYEPADKVGLADITGEVMRTGGTTSRTGDELDQQLEQIAASVETGIGLNSGYASVSVLKDDIDTGLSILADVLMHPAFRADKIELAKVQQRSSISRRNDEPGEIAAREFGSLIYGPDSVYARTTEYATIDNITRDDLVAFHQRYYGPNNMMLAVWGDFDAAQMIAKIEQAFAGWEKTDIEPAPAPQVEYDWPATVNLVARADLNQSNIYVGHIGGLRSDPDYFALTVMNEILGGSFTGRLFKNVRSRQGLAYSVGGTYSSGLDHRGVFRMGCQTKAGSTVHAIQAMIDEARRMTTDEVTDEELKLAKESYLNSFVFNFDSTSEVITRLMTYEYFGYPEDFLQQTRAGVEKVTKADVLRAAREHLRPDKMQILVVGQPDAFDEPLSTLGSVNTIDITIPTPGQ